MDKNGRKLTFWRLLLNFYFINHDDSGWDCKIEAKTPNDDSSDGK